MKTIMKKFVEHFRKHVIYFKLESSVCLRLTKSWLEGGGLWNTFFKNYAFWYLIVQKKDF